MTGEEIARKARSASEGFQVKSSKFAGAMTAELMKTELRAEKITTSARDVYIRGIPLEIDLIVPRHGAKPGSGCFGNKENGIVWEADHPDHQKELQKT